jgi:hypothetical protein
MSADAEAAQMNARLEAECEIAIVEAIFGVVVRWMRSPEGKRRVDEAVDPARAEVLAKWRQILELEEAYRRDD